MICSSRSLMCFCLITYYCPMVNGLGSSSQSNIFNSNLKNPRLISIGSRNRDNNIGISIVRDQNCDYLCK